MLALPQRCFNVFVFFPRCNEGINLFTAALLEQEFKQIDTND